MNILNATHRKSFAKTIATLILFAISVPASAALNFTFNAANQTTRPGEGIQLEWIVTNTGSQVENSVSVEVPLFSNSVNFISETLTDGGDCPGGTCDVNETIVWDIGNLEAGASRTASFMLNVTSNSPDIGIAMNGSLLKGASVLVNQSWTQQVVAGIATELILDSSRGHVLPNQPFSLGVSAGNSGTVPIEGARVSVPIPSAFSILSAPGASINANVVSWSLGDMPAGSVTRKVINLAPNSTVSEGQLLVFNDASLTGTVFGITQGTLADQVITVGASDIQFELRSQESNIAVGEAQNVELVVSNPGNATLQNVSVSTLYPQYLGFISEVESGADCPGGTCDPGELMTWQIGNLRAGETKHFPFRVAPSSRSPNGAIQRWQARGLVGLNTVRREYMAIGNASSETNLQIDVDKTTVTQGENYTYTFNVGNTGVTPIDNTILSVPIPQSVSVVDTHGGTLTGSRITWAIGNVANGAVTHRYLTVRADMGLPLGSLITLIDAELSATLFGIPQSVMSQHIVDVTHSPIELELRIQQATVSPSDAYVLEIVASNTSALVQQNVNANLLYPDNVNFVSESVLGPISCAGGTCDSGELFNVPFGNLLPGETKSFAIQLVILNGTPEGEHTSWVGSVSAAGGFARRVETTLAIANVMPELQITAEQLLVSAGEQVNYKFSIGNSGSETLNQANLSIPIPEGVNVISSPGAIQQGNRLEFSAGSILSGDIIDLNFVFSMPPAAPNGAQVVFENVELSGFLFGIQQFTYANHLVTVGSSPLVANIDVTPVDAKPGEPVSVTLNVINNGNQVEQNVELLLDYPFFINFLSERDTDGGQCNGGTCDPQENIVWSFGSLPPGESRTVNINPTISRNQVEGDMIEWVALAQASGVKQRRIETRSLVGDITLGPVTSLQQCNAIAGVGNLQFTLQSNQFEMLSLPCTPPVGTTINELFGDDIPGEYRNNLANTGNWIVFTWNPETFEYVDPGPSGTLMPGQGFWITQVQPNGSSVLLDLPSGSVNTVSAMGSSCGSSAGCYPIPLSGAPIPIDPETGDVRLSLPNLIGNPFEHSITDFSDINVTTSNGECSFYNNGCTLDEATLQALGGADVMGNVFFRYDGENRFYPRLSNGDTLEPWQGYWVFELPDAEGNSPVVRFPESQ